MRILFVENHAVFASLATQQFLQAHEVVVAASLKEARAQLRGAPFDVVLVDFDLDDGKGDALVRELRDVRIIAVSSHDVGNAALLAAGAHACCPKGRFQEIESFLNGTSR